MAYLKTVLTYHLPSEAEVDKAFLESHGMAVCLLNGNTSRNELGAPFFIQLQVADEEHARAVALLREVNPGRFGSASVVNELDRAIKRTIGLFVLGAGAAAILGYVAAPAPVRQPDLPYYMATPDLRPLAAFFTGILGGCLAVWLGRKRTSPQSPPAVP
ncbi:MAG TPA: hypothetical protein VG734_10790 [Lacunisphaera sp.]|nr:hypothetical protein [Lacunisphaera sp.]